MCVCGGRGKAPTRYTQERAAQSIAHALGDSLGIALSSLLPTLRHVLPCMRQVASYLFRVAYLHVVQGEIGR